MTASPHFMVMPGLVPGIHVLLAAQDVDGRVKPAMTSIYFQRLPLTGRLLPTALIRCSMTMADKTAEIQQAQGAPAARPRRPRAGRDRGDAAHDRDHRASTSFTASSRWRRRRSNTPTRLGKFLPDQDRPNEGVFSFQDDDEQWLSLRYDLTAPLARYVAENFQNLALPYRSYREGWVVSQREAGPGRFRQFMQFDADTVGSASPAADAEICMMAADTMEALGIPRGSYVVKVNSRKVLDGVMETIGLAGEANAGKRLTVLRAIDKLDRLGVEGVKMLLGHGRTDESGDFTKGAELDPAKIDKVLGLVDALVQALELGSNASKVLRQRIHEALIELDQLKQVIATTYLCLALHVRQI